MSNERFKVSVNVTEMANGDGSSSSFPGGLGCLAVLGIVGLLVFGGIGNRVFSNNALIYAPSTTTVSAFPASAACIIGLCIILFFLCIVALAIKLHKMSQ